MMLSGLTITGVVNPARAGMIPFSDRINTRAPGKPRASGDDPMHEIMPYYNKL